MENKSLNLKLEKSVIAITIIRKIKGADGMKISLTIAPNVFTFPRCDPITQARSPVHKKIKISLILFGDNVIIFIIKIYSL